MGQYYVYDITINYLMCPRFGGISLKQYIFDTVYSGSHGLFLCELPTGYGKTYTCSQVMRAYAEDKSAKRKIIYLTTLNKNLPETELLAAFDGDEERYHKAVLRIRSNFDEVTEKLETLDIPDSAKTERYERLLEQVKRYNTLIKRKASDAVTIKEVKDRLNEAERAFRKEVSQKLSKEYHCKKEKLQAIHTDSQWKWVGKLYPAVFTDEHQILLMSISKFMKRNSCIVEPSYEFLRSDMIKDAIIFIDEFDATKDTVKNILIEKALSANEEYLELFRSISRNLNSSSLSTPIKKAYQNLERSGSKQYTFDAIRSEADGIEQTYLIDLSYKTSESQIDRHQNFLFKDATYHTLSENQGTYVRGAVNEDENRIDIFFEKKEEFYRNQKKDSSSIEVYGMLRDIDRFLKHFRVFLYAWANEYQKLVNTSRSGTEDELTADNAVNSILNRLRLTEGQKALITGELCRSNLSKVKKELLPDNSFYQLGMEIFELEDSDTHLDSTALKLVAVHDTPEKLLIYLAKQATVFGISATAEIPSVVGNYNLEYLSEQLGKDYHPTPAQEKEKIRQELSNSWQAYRDGRVRVHRETIKESDGTFDLTEACDDILCSEEPAMICANLIRNTGVSDYYQQRYCNILRGMCRFAETDSIRSMLYLGMALPKKGEPEMDLELLSQLMEFVKTDRDKTQDIMSIVVLRSADYEEEKEKLLTRLENGEKIFIMSTYQTIGAGQNLQYRVKDTSSLVRLVPDKGNGDKRQVQKDIDALYLGDITHLTVNTYRKGRITKPDLLRMLFEIEELKAGSELNHKEASDMIRLAFRASIGSEGYDRNLLYNLDSIRLQASRTVMQAVGRMCRTYLKAPDIYLMIEQKLLEKLSAGELRKHILSPEMEKLVSMREELGAEYTKEEEKILKKAEKISSFGMWNIRQMLSRRWTEDSMKLWEALRQLVLTYPTASDIEKDAQSLIRRMYVTSGNKQNCYLYSQYSDFSDVVIDFSNNKIDFRNSSRAKRRADTNEVLVYEMSQEAAGLDMILKYRGMQEYFRQCGFALTFERNDYMMSPVLFHNIYKGALGEVAGSFILKQELGILLSPITDPERFEFFDFELADGVYVDFKNWKFSYIQDRAEVKKEILRKLDSIGGKRVYIINIIQGRVQDTATAQLDERLIEVPCLIDEHGKIVSDSLKMIKMEDYL